MMILRRLRAAAVVSACFGLSAVVISATLNVGMWVITRSAFPRNLSPYEVFSTAPFAFAIGCLVGIAFSVLLSMRRVRSGDGARIRWLAGTGLLGGALVGSVGAFFPHVPRDLIDGVATVVASMGVFGLVGAASAANLGWIADGRRVRIRNTPVDRLNA